MSIKLTRRTPFVQRTFEVIEKEGQHYVLARCIDCPTQLEIPVDLEKFKSWCNKVGMVQDTFPDLSPDLREMFLSGICPTCWDLTFKEQS